MKENYICSVPFTSLEVHDHKRFLCCASWLTEYLPEDSNPKEAWNSKQANDIRDSILDGSYRYCDSIQCPFLNQLSTFGDVGKIRPLYRKDKLPKKLKKTVEEYTSGIEIYPEVVQFSMDRSCNLECPSCRLDLFIADSTKIKKVKKDILDIENAYGKEVNTLYITGSGDPFISVSFRDFLRTFDKTKWPKLTKIHLHTNATKWNKEMWDSMKNIHPYVKSCEISIDAGTKDTYENKTRINGKWNELLDNLKFINTIPNLKNIKASFVLQKHNFKEIKLFYDLMISIFGTKVNVYYGKITNWGTFDAVQFQDLEVWNKSHPNHLEFVKELNSTLPAKQAWTNMQEFINPHKSII